MSMASATSSSAAEPRTPAPSMRWRIALTVAVCLLGDPCAGAGDAGDVRCQGKRSSSTRVLDRQIVHSMSPGAIVARRRCPRRRTCVFTASAVIACGKPIGDDTGKNNSGKAGTGRGEIPALSLGNHEIVENGREYHVAVRADDQARYVLVYDVEEHEHRVQPGGDYAHGALPLGWLPCHCLCHFRSAGGAA